MTDVKEAQQDIAVYIKEVLSNNEYGDGAKVQAIQKLKDLYKPPDKIFCKVKLESLLQSARVALDTKRPDKDFLFNYGITLVNFFRCHSTLSSEVLYQMEYVLAELKKLDENLADRVGAMFWEQQEKMSVVPPGNVLNASKQTIERIVLDWMDTTGNPRMEFPARKAAASQELFHSVTAVLYEVLVRSGGLLRVLDVTRSFISQVMFICGKEGKDFLKLYPKDCRQLVSLLMVEPEVFSENGRVTVNHVNSLLLEVFLREKYKALILLSHYSAWVHPFRQYLKEVAIV